MPLFLLALSLLASLLPAIFVVGIGQAFRPTGPEPEGRQTWIEFLSAGLALLLGITLLVYLVSSQWGSMVALFLLPSIVALLAETFLSANLTRLPDLGSLRRQRLPLALLLADLILLAALDRLGDAFVDRAALVGGIALALAWWVWQRLEKWLAAICIIQILLLIYSVWAVDTYRQLSLSPAWLADSSRILVALIPGLAIISLAHIFGWVLKAEQGSALRRLLLASLVSAPILLLLAAQAATASAWDVATDGLGGIFFLELTAIFAVAAAMLLAWRLPVARRTPVFLFALILPLIFSGAETYGTYGFDGEWGRVPRARTERRAETITRAILRYHERQGTYPAALADLTPGYLLYLPTPFIIPGQDWCYQGGPDYFRLGYVYRDYFSTPASVKLHASAGAPPSLDWPCQAEADRYLSP